MIRTLLTLLLLVLTAPAVLADVTRGKHVAFSIIQPDPEPRGGERFSLSLNVAASQTPVLRNVVFDWLLPEHVEWVDPRCVPSGGSVWRCTLPEIFLGASEIIQASLLAPMSPAFLQTRAELVSSEPGEPSPLSYTTVLWPRSPGELVARIIPFDRTDAEGRAELRVEVEALTPLPDAVEVSFLLDVAYRMRILEAQWPAGWNCTMTEGQLSCRIPAPAAGEKAVVVVKVQVLDFIGGAVVTMRWIDRGFGEEEQRFAKSWVIYAFEQIVTNTADSGPGSFRQALLEATSGLCRHMIYPCRIAFAIEPPPDGQWITIRPLTPLPQIPFPIVNTVAVDATTQTRIRDTNPLGPEIEIDGSLLTFGDGLVVGAARSTVTGFSIHSFPGSAVVLDGSSSRVESNYLGTDPTGRVARPNGNRGLVSLSGNNEIENNVLSGNGRSGLFALGGYLLIRNNRIGVAADGVTPLGNGASGIYSAPGAGCFIVDNVIAHNVHAGISIHRDTGRFNPYDAIVGRNRIYDNVNGAIDQGLDGPAKAPPLTPVPPVLVSATFDPVTDSTIIRGTFERINHHLYLYDLHFFATSRPHPSGFGEGELYLGTLTDLSSGQFTFRTKGDFRGKFVSAFLVQRFIEPEIPETVTSEFGRTIEVK